MRARRVVAVALILVPAACVAVWPAVSFWRLRYWIEPNGRQPALRGLMDATATGGWLELRHAARSEDDLLRRDAAEYLARRGDRRGLRLIVELCYAYPEGHLKYSPQRLLGELVPEGDLDLTDYSTADAWWEARGSFLVHAGGGRWRLGP